MKKFVIAILLLMSFNVLYGFKVYGFKCVQDFGGSCIDDKGVPRCKSPYTESCGDGCTRDVTCGPNGEFRGSACRCSNPSTPQCPVATIWNGTICQGTAVGTAYETRDQPARPNGGEIVADNGQHGGREISREEANNLLVSNQRGRRSNPSTGSPTRSQGEPLSNPTSSPNVTTNSPLTPNLPDIPTSYSVTPTAEATLPLVPAGNQNPASLPLININSTDSNKFFAFQNILDLEVIIKNVNKIYNRTFNLKVKAQDKNPPIPELLSIKDLQKGYYKLQSDGYEPFVVKLDKDAEIVTFKFYVDLNKNGIKDENEPLIDAKTLNLKILPIAVQVDYELTSGWNLINIPYFNEELKKASDLVYYVEKFNTSVYQVSKYESGNWVHYVSRNDQNSDEVKFGVNFDLIPGESYFVYVTQPVTFSLVGREYESEPVFNLNNGWNLVGFYGLSSFTSHTFLSKCRIFSQNCSAVSRWEEGKFDTVVYEDDTFFGSEFRIVKNKGYFVLNTGEPARVQL